MLWDDDLKDAIADKSEKIISLFSKSMLHKLIKDLVGCRKNDVKTVPLTRHPAVE